MSKRNLPKLIGLRSEPRGMTYDDLDGKMEQPVLDALAAANDGRGMPVAALGYIFYGVACPGKRATSKAQANSWARNALRRPLREGLVERVDLGVYRLTRKGRRQLEKAVAA